MLQCSEFVFFLSWEEDAIFGVTIDSCSCDINAPTHTHTQVNMNTSHIYFSKNALSKLSGKSGLLKEFFFFVMAAQLPFIQPKHHTHHIHPIHLSQVLNEGRIPVVQKELFFF